MPRDDIHGSGGGQAEALAARRITPRPNSRSIANVFGRDGETQAAQGVERETLIEGLGKPDDEAQSAVARAAILLRTDKRGCGQLVSLPNERIRLGRCWESETRLEDDSVSRRHAEITTDRGHFFITDLGSANGTYVNGQRVKSAALHDGCVVRLGSRVTYRFSIVEEDEREALSSLQELAHYDPLTRLHNRRYLGECLGAELAFAERHQTAVSVILLDIDHFKTINDTHGHIVGDRVLEQVSSRIAGQVRTEDVVARYGGEEFMVVLRQTSVEGAQSLAERIRQAVTSVPIEVCPGTALEVTLSAGCSSLECTQGGGAEELVRLADRRLYRAKEEGRNRVVAVGRRLRSVPPPLTSAAEEASSVRLGAPDAGPPSTVQRVAQAASAFERLDAELQMVVGLHYQERCSFAEIAAVLDTSVACVQERFDRAMLILKAA